MTSEHYVYVLLDSSKPGDYTYGEYTFDHEPFYVGKGKSNRIKDTIYDKSSFKGNKIRKMKSEGVEIIAKKVMESLSNEDSIKREIELISKIGRRDAGLGPLVNTTDGGDGRTGSPPSEETKAKISSSKKGVGIGRKHKQETIEKFRLLQSGEMNGFYGKRHSEENKAKHSDRVSGSSHPMFNKKHSAETIQRLVKHRKEVISNDTIREAAKKFKKPVLMYDLSMNFIQEFDSVQQASTETSINESIISKCCRGEIKSPTRYFFRYKNPEDAVKRNKFIVDVGDKFWLGTKVYTLIKRNSMTCICESGGVSETLHVRDHKFLFEKDTNDIDEVEILLFLQSMDRGFRLRDGVITNGMVSVEYLKIVNNSEVFVGRPKMSADTDKVTVFSDEWRDRSDIVKSRLTHMLGKSKKLWARKCEVREIKDNFLVRDFLTRNHIQGYVGSVVKLGLFHKDELVSLMTFGNLRKSMGRKADPGSYELLRFCNRIGESVVGGASRLFKHFLNEYKPAKVVSYADKRWSTGGLYRQLGFAHLGDTVPNYYYIVDGRREYRFKWRKDILVSMGNDSSKTEVEIMRGMNRHRIFDRGSMRFEWTL